MLLVLVFQEEQREMERVGRSTALLARNALCKKRLMGVVVFSFEPRYLKEDTMEIRTDVMDEDNSWLPCIIQSLWISALRYWLC